MSLKTVYLVTIALSFLGVFFLFFLKDPLIYIFYGYEPTIAKEYSAAGFQAIERTFMARFSLFMLVFIITFLCFVLSCISIHRRIEIGFYIPQISLILSFVLSLFYFFLLVLCLITPSRIA